MCLNDTRVTEIVVFWGVTSCSHSGANVWGVTSRSHSGANVSGETLLSSSRPLNMGKAGSAEMLVRVYLTTRRHIPENRIPYTN
jgi:hypothetical protein